MRILRNIVDKVVGFAQWYMRRRTITKIFLFVLFFTPFIVYSYWQASLYTARYTSQPFIIIESNDTITLDLPSVSCNSLFSGKTLYIYGTLIVPQTCYQVNKTVYLYKEKGSVVEILVEGSREEETASVIVLPVNETLNIENTTVHVSKVILVVYGGNYTSIRYSLTKHGLADVFCRVVIPSEKGWSRDTVPEELYDQICLSIRP